MRTPLSGLFYFIWLRTRFNLLCLVAACTGITGLIQTVVWLSAASSIADPHMAADMSLTLNGCLVVGIGSMVFAFFDAEDLSTARFRSCHYLTIMPVRTGLMAQTAMLYTVLATLVLSWAVAAAHAHLFVRGYLVDDAILRKFPLLCVSAVTYIRCACLLGGIRNEIFVGAGAIGLGGAGIASLILFASEKYAPIGLALSLALYPVAYGASCAGIAGFRSGRGQSIIPWFLEKFSMQGTMRTVSFETVESALLWYSWRRSCVPIVIAFVCGGPVALLFGFLVHKYGTVPLKPIPFWHLCFAALGYCLAMAGACAIGQDSYEIVRGSSYLIIQPTRSTRIARGLLLPLAATSMMLFGVSALCVFAASHFLPPPHTWDKFLTVESFAILGACVAITWIIMSCSLYLIALAICIALGAILCHFVFGVRELSTYVWVLDMSLLILGVRSLVFGWHKRYLEQKSVVAMLVAWGLGLFVAQVVAMQWRVDPAVFFPPPPGIPSLAITAAHGAPHVLPVATGALFYVATLFAPLPFIYLPAFIDRYRHR